MEKLDEYIANYDTDNSQSNLYKISEDMGCKVGVDTVIDDLYKFVTDNIEPTFTKKRPRSNKNNFPTNMWFDEECKEQRNLVNTFAKEHDISAHIHKNIYNNLCKKYKQLIQRKKEKISATEQGKHGESSK